MGMINKARQIIEAGVTLSTTMESKCRLEVLCVAGATLSLDSCRVDTLPTVVV